MPRTKTVSRLIPLFLACLTALGIAASAASCTNQKSDDKLGQTQDALCQIGSTCDVTGGTCHRPTVGGGPVCDLTCTPGTDPLGSAYQPTCTVGGCCDDTHLNPGCPMAGPDGGSIYLLCDSTTNVLVAPDCGDGKVTAPEECDPADPTTGPICNPATCLLDRCGDGNVTPVTGEECDLGSAVNGTPGADCTSWCTIPKCGDGEVQAWKGEECDPPGGACGCDCKLITNLCTAPSTIDVPCLNGQYGCFDSSIVCDTTPGDASTELDCMCFNGPDGSWPLQPYGTLLPPGSDCSGTCVPWVAEPDCSSSFCGDGKCEGTENCWSCPIDCGDGCR